MPGGDVEAVDADGLNDKCHNRNVCRDCKKYLCNVPKPKKLLTWAERRRLFGGPILIVWTRDVKLMPTAHAARPAEHFENAQLVWVDASRTLIPIDQPTILADRLSTLLAAHT